jgi:phosphate uptake regulator
MSSVVFLSGKGYKMSVPIDWIKRYGKPIEEGKKYGIDKTQIGRLLIISPPFDPNERRQINLMVRYSDKMERKMGIVTAFLQGYDVIYLTLRDLEDQTNIEAELSSYIEGTIVEKISKNRFKLEFPQQYSLSIDTILDSTVRECFEGLYATLYESLSAFPEERDVVRNQKVSAEKYEKTLDRVTYYFKRDTNLAFSYPQTSLRLKIEDLTDLIHYLTIISNFERASDIHYESVKLLETMLKEEIQWPKIDLFRDLYQEAFEIFVDGIESYRNPRRRFAVIEGKLSGWSNYKGYIEKSKQVEEWIVRNENELPSRAIRYLTILEGKIKAIPDIASNISEAFYDMDKGILRG